MQKWAKPRLNKDGFTIVELLIVIVVIGILAAITIVAYNGIQDRSKNAVIQSDLANAVKSLESYRFTTSTTEKYPVDLATANLKNSTGTSYVYTYDSTNNTYCLAAVNGVSSYVSKSASPAVQPGGCSVTSGLLGWWPLNGNTNDASGNGKNGTPTDLSTAIGQNNVAGNAYNFTLATSMVDLPILTWNTGSFSVTAWFNTSTSGDRKLFSTNTSNPLQIFTGGQIRSCVTGCTPGGPDLADGTWHMGTTVGDATSTRTYVDNNITPAVTQTASASAMNNAARIGRDQSTGNFNFVGRIDDVRLYNRALSVAEIQSMYAAGAQ